MLWLATAHAVDLQFPGTYASLQEAVDDLATQAGHHRILLDQDVTVDQTVLFGPTAATSITIAPASGSVALGGSANPLFDVDSTTTVRLEGLLLQGEGNRLAITHTGVLEIVGSIATDFGTAGTDAGLVWVLETSTLRLLQSTVSGGAARDGGVAESDPGATIEATGSIFTNNSASEDGGVFDVHGALFVEGSVFLHNSAVSAGGAINLESHPSAVTIRDSTFTGNSAGRGGAVFADARVIEVQDCTFRQNAAVAASDGVGGALMVASGGAELTVTQGLFEQNQAQRGSAVYGRNAAEIAVSDSRFCQNTGANGAVSAGANSVLTVEASLFWANDAGGIDLLDSIAAGGEILGNTFVANLIGEPGQAAKVADGAPAPLFQANLVVDHTDTAVLRFERVENVYHHNAANYSGGTSTGEIEGDPVFLDTPACTFESVRVHCDGAAGGGDDDGALTAGVGDCVPDHDGDGFVAEVDCDDGDPLVNPAAADSCNGIDDDCNGFVDDDPAFHVTWYGDADGDGHGAGPATTSCAPLGSSPTGDDCDDARMEAFPGADELCNQLDDDCDGTVDEDAVDGGTWYPDADGDGWGQETPGEGCPIGASASQSGDCDDFAPEVNPGATEVCNGIDDDCSGAVDEGFPVRNRYLDADGDGYGDPTITTIDCQLPPGWTTVADDCDDDDETVHPDGVEDCIDPADNDCDGLLDHEDPDSTRSFWPDADGDGFGDSGSNPLQACEPPQGQVADDGDCDDSDPTVNPAATEIPGDGIDSDCDGASESEPTDRLGITCNQGAQHWFPAWLRR